MLNKILIQTSILGLVFSKISKSFKMLNLYIKPFAVLLFFIQISLCSFFQSIFITTILFNTEITYNGMKYPKSLIALGWASCLLSILCIPIYFVYKLLKMNGSFKKVILIFFPTVFFYYCQDLGQDSSSSKKKKFNNFFYHFFLQFFLQRIRIALTPNNWGPADKQNRKAWEEMIRNAGKQYDA